MKPDRASKIGTGGLWISKSSISSSQNSCSWESSVQTAQEPADIALPLPSLPALRHQRHDEDAVGCPRRAASVVAPAPRSGNSLDEPTWSHLTCEPNCLGVRMSQPTTYQSQPTTSGTVPTSRLSPDIWRRIPSWRCSVEIPKHLRRDPTRQDIHK